MSGSYPVKPIPQRVKIDSIAPALESVSHSLKRQVRSFGDAQQWSFDVVYPAQRPQADFMPVVAFLIAQRGRYETFSFVLPPPLNVPRGAAGGTPVVDGAGQTGRTLNIRGADTNVTGWLKAGDFIKADGHNKVYMVTADADSDGLGDVSLSIEPALYASPADGETLVVADVPFTVALVRDNLGYQVQPGLRYGFEPVVSLQEWP